MQRDQTLISVTNILTTGDIASVSSYIAGTYSLATTVNAIKNKTIPTLATGNLRYNGSAWVFDSTAYLAISAVNNGGPTETLISRIRSDSTQLATLSWDGFNMIFNRSPLISTLTGGSNGMVGANSSGALFRATAGTDYLSSTVGNAVSATKLLNARTIGLSGGVTGTATSFDGTANITIPVTTVAPSFIGTGYTQNRFYIDTHPEGGGVIIPFINNDIAHLIARGGTMTSYKTSDTTFTAQTLTNIGSVAIDTTAPFDGSPSYAYVPTLVVTDKLIIDITCPAVYSYVTTVYIDFGNSAWSAKDVSFYAYNSNVNNSETLYKAFGGAVTNNQQGRYFVIASYSYVNTSAGTSQGFNKLRIVLTNFQGTSPRIAAIGVVNFDSRGSVVPFMSRAGGALYGSITPQSTNTLNLGSASNLFANIYTTSAKIGTINGLLKGVSGVVTLATAGDVNSQLLTGYTIGANTAVLATDSILGAFQKVQAQINARSGTVTSVALTAPANMTASGSPITSSGTLGLAWNGSSTYIVRADGSTVAQSTFATAAALSGYLPLAGGEMTGPITGNTAVAAPIINVTTTFGNLTNAAIRATASASDGCALHGIATGTSGAGVWGTSSNTGGDGGLFSGQGGSNAIRAIASGGGKAGIFVGDVQVSGSLLSNGNGFGVGSSAITISSSSPVITLNCTSAPLDAKQWHLSTDLNGDLIIQTRKDNTSGGIVLLQATRVGDAISSLSLGTTTTSTYIKALTSYGFVKTNSSGLLSVDTDAYLPTSGGVVSGSTTFNAGLDTLSLYVSGSTVLVGGINGVTNGSAAATGIVGEILTTSNSGTTFTGTTAGIALNSISLPAGSWLVWAGCSVSNGTSPSSLRVFLSYSSTGTTYIDSNASFSLGSPALGGVKCNHAPIVINRNTTATVYLVGSEITTGTAAVCTGSTIYALRLR